MKKAKIDFKKIKKNNPSKTATILIPKGSDIRSTPLRLPLEIKKDRFGTLGAEASFFVLGGILFGFCFHLAMMK